MADWITRFSPYWRQADYVVRAANGQALAYIYSRDNAIEARQAKMLTKDEVRRIVVNIAAAGVVGEG